MSGSINSEPVYQPLGIDATKKMCHLPDHELVSTAKRITVESFCFRYSSICVSFKGESVKMTSFCRLQFV